MGLFSFECSKSNVSIPAYLGDLDKRYSKIVQVTPNNRKIKGVYDGYGRIIVEKKDRFDIFVEIMRDLHPELPEDKLRDKFFENYEENLKYVKIVRQDYYKGENYEELDTSKNCEYQGHFYPKEYIEKHYK